MTQDLYREVLLDLYEHPQFKKKLHKVTHTAQAVNASCGDEGTLFLHIENEKILDVGWQGQGCVISTVAMETVCALLINKEVSELAQLDRQQLLKELELESLAPGREKCLLLPLRALEKIQPVTEEHT